MFVPTLSVRTTNVELSGEYQAFMRKNFFSLGKYIANPSDMHIDLVMRQHKGKMMGKQFYLSVKLSTAKQSYMTVAIASRFGKVVRQACRMLKRQLTSAERPKQLWAKPKRTLLLQ